VWWRRPDPVLDRETLDGIIRMLMHIDFKLDVLIAHFGLSDDEEGEDEDDS
jgi:hypothetical protein